jgi:hypothetical protein
MLGAESREERCYPTFASSGVRVKSLMFGAREGKGGEMLPDVCLFWGQVQWLRQFR